MESLLYHHTTYKMYMQFIEQVIKLPTENHYQPIKTKSLKKEKGLPEQT